MLPFHMYTYEFIKSQAALQLYFSVARINLFAYSLFN
jgi:hypothetical protein